MKNNIRFYARTYLDGLCYDLPLDEYNQFWNNLNENEPFYCWVELDGPPLKGSTTGAVVWCNTGGDFSKEVIPEPYTIRKERYWSTKEVSHDEIKDWFNLMGWNIEDGLDSDEKKMLFKLKFL